MEGEELDCAGKGRARCSRQTGISQWIGNRSELALRREKIITPSGWCAMARSSLDRSVFDGQACLGMAGSDALRESMPK
jgi:hypothetical protein